jgi:hypothetical protein
VKWIGDHYLGSNGGNGARDRPQPTRLPCRSSFSFGLLLGCIGEELEVWALELVGESERSRMSQERGVGGVL